MRWRGSTASREGPQTGVTTSQRRTSLWLLQSTASSAMAAIAEAPARTAKGAAKTPEQLLSRPLVNARNRP